MPRLAPKVTRLLEDCGKRKKTVLGMIGIFLAALIFCPMTTQKGICSENAHPGVVCVIAWEPESPSRGSGSLIGKKGLYGYIITNWHVVRDSTGLVMVRYADGTITKGVVVSVDSLWDLALIATTLPQAEPIRIASSPPQKGDPLWLAGYGADNTYKMAGGYCTQYASPSVSHKVEKELLEFSAAARMGDSGGPIFNRNLELAGVLFGTNSKVTLGSYCGRVLKFIDQSAPYVLALPNDPEELFKQAMTERRTILQRNTVTKSSVTNASLPTIGKTESQPIANHSSSSSFGGGGSKRRATNTTPVVDPFMSVESIQPHLGFQGLDYKKEIVSAVEQNQTTYQQVVSPSLPPMSSQYPQSPSPQSSGNGGYSSSGATQNPASGSSQSSWKSPTPAREIAGGTVSAGKPPLTPSASAVSMLPYSSSGTSSQGGNIYHDNRYGQNGTAAKGSVGLGAPPPVSTQGVTALPPVTSSPYAIPSGSNNGSAHSTSYSGYGIPANKTMLTEESKSSAPDKSSEYGRKTNDDDKNNRTSDYFGGSYSNSSTFPGQENYSSYSRFDDPGTGLMEGEIHEKYASPTSIPHADPGSPSKTMMTPRNAVKIIGAVIVIFFVLFHAVKLMSIIEEQ